MADLTVNMGNLEIENPIIVSSGHLTRTGDDIKRCDRYGPGAVVTKSSFLEKEYEKVVKPYAPGLFPDARAKFHATGDGYLGMCGLSPIPVEVWAKWFKDHIKEINTTVIGSIMGVSLEGYINGARMFQEAGAGAIEICLGCPLPYLLSHPYVGGAAFNPEIIEEICTGVRKAVDIPVGVKLTFNPMDPSPLRIPHKVGLDWVTIAVVFPAAPGIALDEIEPEIPLSIFISGSKAAKHANFISLLSMADLHRDIHISSSGGMQKWNDVVESIMYGAGSVQIHTLFMQKGLGVIGELNQGISSYMDSRGFGSIEEMKGAILGKLVTYDEVIATYGKTGGRIVASVDQEKCTGCEACEDVCNWEAIRVSDGKIEIDRESCEGCGLCVCACPTEALWLENVELIRQLARG